MYARVRVNHPRLYARVRVKLVFKVGLGVEVRVRFRVRIRFGVAVMHLQPLKSPSHTTAYA